MTTKKKQSKAKRPKKHSVELTDPEWRALAAVLYVARGIATDPTHATLLNNLYAKIQQQVNVELDPIEEK